MYYNENRILNKNIGGKSSEFILFKSLDYFALHKNVFKAIQFLYDLKKDDKKLIWGCKKQNDVYRWEIYYYHYESNDISATYKKDIDSLVLEKYSKSILRDLYKENVIIHSIDILNKFHTLNEEIHSYECDKNKTTLPFYGSGYDYINNQKIKVGSFIYDSYENCLANYKTYFKDLNLESNEKIYSILKKYNS
jgi:hypothetical protein